MHVHALSIGTKNKAITLDDIERINGRFRITINTISSEIAIFSLFTQNYVVNDKYYTATDTRAY